MKLLLNRSRAKKLQKILTSKNKLICKFNPVKNLIPNINLYGNYQIIDFLFCCLSACHTDLSVNNPRFFALLGWRYWDRSIR